MIVGAEDTAHSVFPLPWCYMAGGSMLRPGLRCLSLVALEQPAEPFPANDRPVPARGLGWFHRATVTQPLVRSFEIVMLDVLFDHVPNVPFAEKDHALETLSFGILYPCLGICV